MNNSREIELTHNDYTVGWVCALPTEQTASIAMLDYQHPDLPKPANDQNIYTLGSIYGHNIVVACLPMGRDGVISVATVATQMVTTFPRIKFGVMGGDWRRIPIDAYPGVVQWDFGKAENDGTFKRTSVLNSPPKTLLPAVSKLQTRREMEGFQLYKHLETMENNWLALILDVWLTTILSLCTAIQVILALESGWWYPGLSGILFRMRAAGSDPNAKFWNRLNEQLGGKVLCIEMEAAGLMNKFPCTVTRGICDYRYAATIAAATAKELLRREIPGRAKVVE
ncbi:hypothetical protein BJX64DRAFT_273730 [Aspergillus heterothallicus]